MSFFARAPARPTVEGIFDSYAKVLEKGPRGSATVFALDELPADKSLVKAVLLQKAFEIGVVANEVCRAGFAQLAAFRAQPDGRPETHVEIAAEMTLLIAEWDSRVRFEGLANA